MRWLKWIPIALGLLVAGAVAAVIAIVNSHSTDCFADFQSTSDAARVVNEAHAIGLNDAHLIELRRSASIRISSGETGDDARGFRQTVRRLVRAGGGHLEKNTPCIERPVFD
jgi:hypothetical protein